MVNRSIYFDKSLEDTIKKNAQAAGVTISQWVNEACQIRLDAERGLNNTPTAALVAEIERRLRANQQP